MFLQVCVILFTGGGRGRAWFSRGGVRNFFGGACIIFWGGVRGFLGGGMRNFFGGAACIIFSGGAACVIFSGGACVFFSGGACVIFWGGVHNFFQFFFYNEIRSMSGRYASYWNAFLFLMLDAGKTLFENRADCVLFG